MWVTGSTEAELGVGRPSAELPVGPLCCSIISAGPTSPCPGSR